MITGHSGIQSSAPSGTRPLEPESGFFHFFIHPNRRTVQDRSAETIVVSERTKRAALTPVPVEEETAPPEPDLAGSTRE